MISRYAMMAAAMAIVAAPMLVRAVECGRTARSEITAAAPREQADEPVRDVGYMFLVAAPGLLIARRLRGLGLLLAVACGYVVFAVVLSPTNWPQLLLPIVPVFAVALAWVWCEWRRLPRPAGLVAHATLLVVLVAGASAAVLDVKDKWQVALGRETRDNYLLAHEPTYRAAALLNQFATPRARLLSQDPRGFYFNCRVTPAGDWRQIFDDRAPKQTFVPEDFAAMLAEGFTHVLLVEPMAEGEPVRAADSHAVRRPSSAADASGVMRLHEYVQRGSDGTARRYGLYMLR